MTRLAVRSDAQLRDYVYAFISTFAAPLRREAVDAARLAPGCCFQHHQSELS